MTVEHLLAFNVVLLAATLSPGPALLIAIRTTLSSGRSAGISIGAGLALMAAIWTLMALLGISAVFRWFPWLYTTARIAGALYLLFIAYRMWTDTGSSIEKTAQPTNRAFRRGVLINLLNPKSVLFATAVLIVVFPTKLGFFEGAMVFANHLALEIVFYTALAFAMSSTAVSRRYLSARRYFDRTASVVLGALGVRLLVDR